MSKLNALIAGSTGYIGIQLVKLVEAMVRVWRSDLETELCTSGVLSKVIKLMFIYKTN